MTRDIGRSAVYAAENIFANMLVAAESGSHTVQIAGATLTVPAQAKFSSIDSMQTYVDRVLARPSVITKFGPTRPVRVRARRSDQATAHYERATATIAVPLAAQAKSMRTEASLLHELGHHFTPDDPGHGPKFTATLLWLLDDVMGPESAFMLRVLYLDGGVKVG